MTARGLYVTPSEFVHFADPSALRPLSEQIATRDRSPDFAALSLLLPNPDPILKKQGRDIAIYTELRSDAHVGGCIRRRKAGVLAMEWRLQRGNASARTLKICQAAFDALDMRRILREMLDAPLFGWQPMEIVWSQPLFGGATVPLDVLAKPVTWFQFDANAQLRFRSRNAPLYGEELPERKFLVPAQDASYANPYGFADLSMCFWPTVFKRGGLKFWVTFAEKYGTPWLIGKTPRGTPPAEQSALLDNLEAMVQDAVAVIPDDASVDIVESAGKTASADLYERLLMFCRSEIAIALLGQNQTTEVQSNRASATAGLQVVTELRDADARLVEATLNQLLRWIVDLNEGPGAAAPTFELYEQEEVDTTLALRDKTLTESGAKLTPAYFARVYGFEPGDIAEPPPQTMQTPAPLSGAAQNPAFADAAGKYIAPAQRMTTTEMLVQAMQDQWQSISEPMVAPLRALFAEAENSGLTAQELLDKLPSTLPEVDVKPLTEKLAQSAFIARVIAANNADNADNADLAKT